MVNIPFVTNHWYYNTESGELTNGNNIENLGNNLLGGLGWHELNIPGNASEAQAAAEAQKEFPKGKGPTTSIAKGLVNQSGSILGGFNLSSWFLRIGEILLGLVLIGVGIARVTGAQNAISKVVRTKI